MNINPLYLQEVSREYYTKILNKSPQQKAAARLTKRWLAKNPTASKKDIMNKFMDFSTKVHYKYGKNRKRQPDNTVARSVFQHMLMDINNNPKEWKARGKPDPKFFKDGMFQVFKQRAKILRDDRLKDLSKIKNNIFEL